MAAGIIERMEETRGWLPEDLVLMPPGPQLAAVLAGVDRACLCDEDLVRLAQARHRLNAHLQAQLLADLHECVAVWRVDRRRHECVCAAASNT